MTVRTNPRRNELNCLDTDIHITAKAVDAAVMPDRAAASVVTKASASAALAAAVASACSTAAIFASSC